MKQPSAALEAYLRMVKEDEAPWWWRLVVASADRARELWVATKRRLWGWGWSILGAARARSALAAAAGELGLPPLPPWGGDEVPRPARSWRTCEDRARDLVASGAKFCVAAAAANRARRAAVALDLCAASPRPPNLDALPLDRAADAKWGPTGGPRRDVVRRATAAAATALDDLAPAAARLDARVVAAAAQGLDRFARGDDDAPVRLASAARAVDEARAWLTAACRDTPPESREAKRLRAKRERLELAAAAAYAAELALARGDRAARDLASRDAADHARAALHEEENEEERPSRTVHRAHPPVVVVDAGPEDLSFSPASLPPDDAPPPPPERTLFAAEATGQPSAAPPLTFTDDDAAASDARDARAVVDELQRALRARHPGSDDEEEDVVVVDPPATFELAADPRFKGVASLLSARLKRGSLKKTASEPLLAHRPC